MRTCSSPRDLSRPLNHCVTLYLQLPRPGSLEAFYPAITPTHANNTSPQWALRTLSETTVSPHSPPARTGASAQT